MSIISKVPENFQVQVDSAIEHQLACAQKQNRIESPSTSDRCETCGESIGESLSHTQCQDCWEASCSESWWEIAGAVCATRKSEANEGGAA